VRKKERRGKRTSFDSVIKQKLVNSLKGVSGDYRNKRTRGIEKRKGRN